MYALGAVKPHVYRCAYDVGPRFGITTIYGVAPRDGNSDHPLGLALDFMVGRDTAKGDAVAAYVLQNLNYYGVHYIIWKQRIWNRDRAAEGWRAMPDRGSITANHYDHVHVSFLTSAQFAQIIDVAPGPIDPVRPDDPRLPPGIRPPGWDTLTSVVDALKSIGKIFAWLTDTHNWLRVGEFVLGVMLIISAVVRLGLEGAGNA